MTQDLNWGLQPLCNLYINLACLLNLVPALDAIGCTLNTVVDDAMRADEFALYAIHR